MLVTYFSDGKQSWIIVGSNGFVGSAITNCLYKNISHELKISAAKNFCNYDEIDKIVLWIAEIVTTETVCQFVFAFGKGGFHLLERECLQLHQSFRQLIDDISAKLSSGRLVYVYYLSSLGACLSRLDSPYKHLIAKNEEYLEFSKSINSVAFRLPSLWGFKQSDESCSQMKAYGILANLLLAAKNNTPATIFGGAYTTRLYMSIDTVAIEIVSYLIRDSTHLSLSNNSFEHISIAPVRSYSIAELILLVRRVTRKKLMIKFAEGIDIHVESHYISSINGSTFTALENIQIEVQRIWTILNQFHSQ
jgi:hypothetical protein